MDDTSWLWVFQLLGRLHPLVVHFPIGLLVVGFFLELLTVGGKRKGLREGINWLINLGAFFAVLSLALGFLLRTHDDYSGDLLFFHQNMGISTVVFSLLTVVLLRNTLKEATPNFLWYRLVLGITVIVLSIAGHLGAKLTHGEDFLSEVFPSNQSPIDDAQTAMLLAQLEPLDSLSDSQQDELNLKVRAIFAHNCYKCHNENKQKGELVLDNKRGVFKGGESGAIIAAFKPEESDLYRRISLEKNHKEVMPNKGKVLKKYEIALIKLWIKKGAYWSDRALEVFPEAPLALSMPKLPASSRENNPLDKLIDTYFEKNKVDWPDVVDDRTFIRRVYMDIVGLLPEPEKVEDFLADRQPEKRDLLIDELLSDHTNYTQNWLSFWNDLLRNDYSGTGFITGGRKQISKWLYESLEDNKPYDQMVRELVNPNAESEGFIKGIEWRGVVNASQRTEMQAAQNIGQSLMGVNVKCASCHNSFVSNLTLEQSYGFASVFSETPLELNRCDIPMGKIATPGFIYKELGSVEAETLKERLRMLSEIMVKPENGRLYRTISNRIWKKLLGRGIVEPVDEMDKTPWDADVLDWLAADFIESGSDIKHLIKTIMRSKAYQLPSPNYEKLEEIKSAKYVFEGPLLRRLSAEQFSDAVSQVIAPVYHAVAFDPADEGLSFGRVWHRERKFGRDVLPEPGKRFFRRIIELPDKELRSANILLSVDHSYQLWINGKSISKGQDWRKVEKLDVKDLLRAGENMMAIEASNEGELANPAGILFALKMQFSDGKEMMESSIENWKSTDEPPGKKWTKLSYDDSSWPDARNYGSGHWDKLVNFSFHENENNFARASLVKQHPFLKALGRPSRENVSTSRNETPTLLQALELSNGAYFNTVLQEGAADWKAKYSGNSSEIISELYLQSFGREPSKKEASIMLNLLGEQAEKQSLQDLFWSVLLLPEFQFIN